MEHHYRSIMNRLNRLAITLFCLAAYLSILTFTPTALAQNTFTCSYRTGEGIEEECFVSGQSCRENFAPDCRGSSKAECLASSGPCISTETPQTTKDLDLAQLIGNFYNWALGIGGVIALGIIIFGGILYTISPGDSSRQNDAKTWIGSAIVGLVLLFGSYAILNTVNPDLTKLVSLEEGLKKAEFGAHAGTPQVAKELDLSNLIANFYQWALGIGGLVALGVLIFGGILYTTSAGNASRQDDAKQWIMGALLGILLLSGSYAILNTVNPELTKLTSLKSMLSQAEFRAPAAPPAAPSEPPKPGEKVPLGIAQQIGNFYQWALGIGGLLALGVLIFGGILYTISAGNASRQDDAKQWLSGALIGILLLFGSFLVLNTINPELTKLKDLELIVNKAVQRVIDLDIPKDLVGFKKDLLASLKQSEEKIDAANSEVNTRAWFAIAGCESSYHPNIKVYGTPDPAGACGLFQMSCACRGNDCGVGDWQTQVQNARALLLERGPCYWDCADGRIDGKFNGYSLLRIDPQLVANKGCKWHY